MLKTLHTKEEGSQENSLVLEVDPPKSFFGNIQYLKETLSSLLNQEWRIYIFADSENQALRVGELLKEIASTNLFNKKSKIASAATSNLNIGLLINEY